MRSTQDLPIDSKSLLGSPSRMEERPGDSREDGRQSQPADGLHRKDGPTGDGQRELHPGRRFWRHIGSRVARSAAQVRSGRAGDRTLRWRSHEGVLWSAGWLCSFPRQEKVESRERQLPSLI